MCELLQTNFGWPTSGQHCCFSFRDVSPKGLTHPQVAGGRSEERPPCKTNIDCQNMVTCIPTNSALCSECHPKYHATKCSHCPHSPFISPFPFSYDINDMDDIFFSNTELKLEFPMRVAQLIPRKIIFFEPVLQYDTQTDEMKTLHPNHRVATEKDFGLVPKNKHPYKR